MAEVKAQLRSLRMAPRKVRAVSNLLKGKKVSEALNQLEYFVRRPVSPIKKLLVSAIANAENNFNMVKDNLYVKEMTVDEGIKLKRFRARGFGRAGMIQKKTSHIKLILDELKPGLRREKVARSKKDEHAAAEDVNTNEVKKSIDNEGRQSRPEIKREMGSKGNMLGNIGRKMFQRKSV